MGSPRLSWRESTLFRCNGQSKKKGDGRPKTMWNPKRPSSRIPVIRPRRRANLDCISSRDDGAPRGTPFVAGPLSLSASSDRGEKRKNFLTHSHMGIYYECMARAATTSDAFNAVAEPRRREILNY